jgi:hypothetical protein
MGMLMVSDRLMTHADAHPGNLQHHGPVRGATRRQVHARPNPDGCHTAILRATRPSSTAHVTGEPHNRMRRCRNARNGARRALLRYA